MISLQIDVGLLIGSIFYFIFPSLDISEAHILQNLLYPVADTRKSEYSDTVILHIPLSSTSNLHRLT